MELKEKIKPSKELTYYEIIRSEEFLAWFGDWITAYKTAGVDFKHPAWKNVSKVVNGLGQPLKFYHGTTHDWTVYSRKLGNHENDMGIGFYATSDYYDAEENYLSRGMDLKTRIEQTAEHLKKNKGTSMAVSKKLAEKKYKGKEERIIEVFIKVKNLLVITTKGYEGTNLDFAQSYDENTEEYTDSKDLIKFEEAFNAVCEDFDFSYDDKNRVWGEFRRILSLIIYRHTK